MQRARVSKNQDNVYYLPPPAAQQMISGRRQPGGEAVRAALYMTAGAVLAFGLSHLSLLADAASALMRIMPPQVV